MSGRRASRRAQPNPEWQRLVYSPAPLKKYHPTSIFSQPQGLSTAKPAGLWYSCGDEWASWMRRRQTVEQLNRLARTKFVYELELNPQRMLFIRTPEEFDAFERRFGRDGAIDWWSVVPEYGGIEICPYRSDRAASFEESHDRAKWEGRRAIAAHWYDLWDVASGVVWGLKMVKKIIPLGDFTPNRRRSSRPFG